MPLPNPSDPEPFPRPETGLAPASDQSPSSLADTKAYHPSNRDETGFSVCSGLSGESRSQSVTPLPVLSTEAYEVLGVLGRGGMGVVYKARHRELDRVVALKTMRFETTLRKDCLDRFEREARILAHLNNPGIVTIYEIGHGLPQPFFSMEYVSGGTLFEHRGRYRDPHRVARLLARVARAIQYAHEQGILHRDLKPHNILLGEGDEPKVSDFGLAKLYEEGADLTLSGDTLGTPAYMAPEQAAGRTGEVGPATDVWALGVILYEMLTGTRPFVGDNRQETLQFVLHREPQEPRRLRPDLDRRLEAIVLRCLEKAPGRRYASARELAEDLEAWLGGQEPRARPRTWPRKLSRFLRGPRGWMVPVGVCLLATLLMFLPSDVTKPHSEPKPPTDRPETLKKLLDRLKAGESVELLGASGAPEWYRRRTEAHRPPVVPSKRLFNLDSLEIGLMELLPEVPLDQYRFRAEVRELTTLKGDSGLYFARSDYRSDAGPEHWFGVFSFSEPHPRDDRPHLPDLRLCRFRERPPAVRQLFYHHSLKKGPPIEAGPRGWRTLAVEVDNREIRTYLDGRLQGSVPRTEPQEIYSTVLDLAQPGTEAPPNFNPKGGLGLFVNQADAYFRHVVVEPLP